MTIPHLLTKNITSATADWREIFVSLKWRTGSLRLRLTPHDITPEGTVAEWHEGNNFTEVDILRDRTKYYRGQVVGKDHSYVALAFDGDNIVCVVICVVRCKIKSSIHRRDPR